ncbi:MAG: molybdopterin molybdotransferase MoeA [Eubacteriales bacterium]|nr:molybdopterin molybdotransferase MoeA [Eubacteriales bacterium]
MIERGDYRRIRDALLASVSAVDKEETALEAAAGRILAQDVIAAEDVPSFARSPYDGYVFRAEDVKNASAEHPVMLRITDYIPAGEMPHVKITAGTAAHLMTGAPVPEGADAVLPFEKTLFTEETVTIREPVPHGSNVILPGEDVRKGTVLAHSGTRIDAGLAGTLAGQGIFRPGVYRVPLVGVISTGTEILEEGDLPKTGKIYNTNRYSLQAACAEAGCRSVYFGTARDEEGAVCEMLLEALGTCDAVLLSGGVSVGDFDCTPAAMEKAGVKILARGAALKPGMAGAYGIFTRENKETGNPEIIPVMALSGNPAACMTAFYAIALPVLKKRMGLADVLPQTLQVRLKKEYQRKNQSDRMLRGRIDLAASVQEMSVFEKQGNQMLSSLAGANAFALIPAGAVVPAGEPVEAFLLE